ncbi:hypothetical protein ASZ97_06935 [Brucella melitensis]|nr:hypothetical protein DK62_849 [Brucella melitensis bv. 3 str. Ether]AOG49371.1 hypothetical protein BFL33_02675 [Brucella melitensis]ENQ88848.1 hypothetical protein C061_02044 [Brucella melitensis F5/07-239A]ENQ95958.1 hypothetical protein C035_01650 [Brucella melitensis R3/07-2]ENS90156.1 hypothetical protein B984_01228 [Brucella melitensis UK31/99]ENT74410.1 hypothetical protein D628_01212 [Brucella melitensis F15/06-7]
MVLQVLAHAGAVGHQVDAVFLQMRGRPDAGKHQQFGRVDGRGGNNHFAPRADGGKGAARLDFHPDGAFSFQHDLARKPFDQLDIRALESRFQIGIGG